jgi:zinc protease
VRRVYETVLDPSTTTIVLAGAVDHAVIDAVQKQFGSWRAHAHSAATPVKVTWRTGPRLVVVDRPGSVQSEIAFGALTPTRASPDYFAMELVHQLLGAHRSSRLTRALVEGATHMDARRAEGNFYWQSSVPLARTATVLRQIDQQLKDLGQTPPSAAELDGTKARYIRQLPLWIETAGETAGAVQTIASYALPLDALDGIAPGIQSVTPDAIQKLAADRLSADHTRVVIVGDWSKLKADLKALAWGPIELRDASGKILRVER